MKRIILIINFVFLIVSISAQKTISLQECIDSAIVNYPLYKQKALFYDDLDLKLKEISNTNLPQLELNARASYQNEVVRMESNIPIMTVPELSKDQYRLSLDISQSIYNGGVSKQQKEIEKTNAEISEEKTENELYGLKIRVAGLYYQVVLTDKQISVAESTKSTLSTNIKEIEILIKEGAALPSAADALKAELLDIDQMISELETDRIRLLNDISELSEIEMSNDVAFELPEFDVNYDDLQQRPEYNIMSLEQSRIKNIQSLKTAVSRPKVYAWANLGYGRPGFNVLSDDFDDIFMVGIGLNWELWNWRKYKSEKERLDVSYSLLDIQKEAFLTELQLQKNELKAEIRKQESALERDLEKIKLRESIAKTAESQFKNGVITGSGYVDDLNKVVKAKMDFEIHKIKLSIAKTNYLWVLGKL